MIIGSWIHRTRPAIFLTGTLALVVLTGLVVGPASPSQAATQWARDIYAAAGTPCVAVHSTGRALCAAYTGNLYQVKRASDDPTSGAALVENTGSNLQWTITTT